MKTTTGPLIIEVGENGHPIYLKDPQRRSGLSVATVWGPLQNDRVRGDAVSFAHTALLVQIVTEFSNFRSSHPLVGKARQLLADMQRVEEDLRSLPAADEEQP